MPAGRQTEKDSLHLRVDARVVKGVDALAVVWGVSRNEAANRLLDEGVGLHIDEIVEGMSAMIERYKEGRFEPPDLLADEANARRDERAG